MSTEPGSLILQMLRQMRAELATKADLSELATKGELDSLRSEMKSDMRTLRADVASDLMTTRKELGDQIIGLRRAVIDYHTSVIGHGLLISDLEARVRRVEQHLNLPSLTAG
ncbi:MAG: hypothetical protein WAK41_05450 [Roseiarcus sp.]|jgi:hypothetical protein|uniref:hypothetical protein n=1 Tax=Roseiarcus sp. TaxID=1969460 RepID=UPI003BB1F1B9